VTTFKDNINDRKIIKKIIRDRGEIFFREHINYIERIISKTSGQVSNLNPEKLQEMINSLKSDNPELIKQLLKEISNE